MQPLTLDEILAYCDNTHDPLQRRQNLIDLLEPGEAIFAYLDPGSRLLLATEKRLVSTRLQREGFSRPRLTWIIAAYNYEDINVVQYVEATTERNAYVVVSYLGSDLHIADTPRLQAFSSALNVLVRQWKAKLKSAPPDQQGNLPSQLRDLYALYQSGVLDADEYKAAKRKLVGI